MREIKFRAWVPKMKKMFYSVGFCSRGVEVYWYDPKLEEETVLGDRQENSLLQYVIPMQYTGLKDKNGKEIYEGDIVKCKLSSTQRYKGIIQFKTGHFFIHAFWYSFKPIGRWDLEKRKLCGKSSTNLSIDCEMEVIGNVFENPGLLEGK